MAHFFEPAPLLFHAVEPFLSPRDRAFERCHADHGAPQARRALLELYFESRRGSRVLYASDTGWYDPPTWKFLENLKLDAAIVECGKGISTNPYDGHLSLTSARASVSDWWSAGRSRPSAPFYLTHICHTGGLLHDELSAHCEPLGIQVAYDGLEVVV